MEEPKLRAKIRDKMGKGYARKLRKRGSLPAILYGRHLRESIPLEIEMEELRQFLSLHPAAREKVFTLNLIDEKANEKREVIIKSFQRDPVKRELQHIDFYEITRGEKITTIVPLSFVGKAQGVKKGGIVEYLQREVEIECFPRDIPTTIEVDLTPLDIGDSLSVKDLKVPSKVKILTYPEERIVSIVPPARREEVEEEVKAAPEEVEVVGKKEKEAEVSGQETSKKEESKTKE